MAENERTITGAETNTVPVNGECEQTVADGGNAVKAENGLVTGDKTVSQNGNNIDDKPEKTKADGYGNLIKYSDMTPVQKQDFHSKGGKASAESRRQRRAAKEIAQDILETIMSERAIDDVLDGARELIGDDRSAYAVLIAKMVQEGMAGNVNAFTAIRDTAGDKPTDKAEVTAAITPADMALVEKVRRRLESEEVTE